MFTLKVLGKKNDEMRSEAEGVDEKGVSWLPELKQITRVIETMSCIFTLHTNLLCIPKILHFFCLFFFVLPEKQNFRIKNPITYVFDEEICNLLAVFFYISN